MGRSENDSETVLARFDAVIRETMVHLHRAQGERLERAMEQADWQAEREELRAAAETSGLDRVNDVAVRARAVLRSAVARIDHMIERSAAGAP